MTPKALNSVPRAAASRPPSDISGDDWDLMFRAVRARLRRLVGEPPASGPDDPTQRGVLECELTLGQLQSMLADERQIGREREAEIAQLRGALVQARYRVVRATPRDRVSSSQVFLGLDPEA